MTLKKGNDLFIIINIVGHSMCLSLSCVEISSGRERERQRIRKRDCEGGVGERER